MNSKWKEYKIKDIAKMNSASIMTKDNYEFINYLDTGNITEGKIEEVQRLIKGIDKFPSRAKRKVSLGDIIYSTVRPNLKHFGIIKESIPNLIVSTGFAVLSPYKNKVEPYFLYSYLSLSPIIEYLASVAETSTTTYPSIKPSVIENLSINLPPLSEQKRIAEILSSLDDKIELNNKMNKTLEEMAQAIFKQWFVDFEFPDENGNPYKSSGGKMIQSELGEIPDGWSVGILGEIIDIYDSKRVPLSSREREVRKGIYPYYGATSIMDYIDDYLFEGTYLLMGEDGTVADADDYPILQYVWGKFWVNNHAHIFQGKHDFSTEYLYLLLKQTNVSAIITGAVQKKINQGNMNSLKVFIPQKGVLENFNKFVKEIFMKYKENTEEIRTLTNTRELLLPKLMSGEITV